MSDNSLLLNGAKVLLVDDNPGNINLLREVLEPDHYSLYFAVDGEKALAVANKVIPDLILLDVMMPGIDGFETCRQLKQIEKTKHIPIIFVTAKTDLTDLEQGFAVGGVDYIHKPIQPTEVQARVKTHLELQRSRSKLAREKEQAHITLMSIGDGVITTDADGHIDKMNPVAERLTGWTYANAHQQPIDRVFQITTHEQVDLDNPARQCLISGIPIYLNTDISLRPKSGDPIAIESTITPITDTYGNIVGSVTVFHDVTQARELIAQIEYQANHDALTGLINRAQFERLVRQALQEAHNNQTEHFLFYMDLDQFKVVNDTCGHIAGDDLLRQVTGLLRSMMRQHDTLARLGGDEFGVLLSNCTLTAAYRIASAMLEAMQEYRFAWDNKTFVVGVSIGMITITPHTESIEKLFSRADSACYAAKDAGRNRIHFYAEDDASLIRREGEMEWVSHITQAFGDGRMRLQAQEIVPIKKTSEKRHIEVLIRMVDEHGNMIPPNAFLPAAERYNLMPTIDRWVVRTMFRWLHDHPDFVSNLKTCAINLSGHTLGDDFFPQFVDEQFKQYHISPTHICFEITETAAITNLYKANEFIHTLKSKGCRFSLDDFGSGLSSYSYLKNLPVDYIKIDGTFIRDLEKDQIDFILVKSINEVGHAMGKMTIAEFVENEPILVKLREIGVDYAQGYGIAKPVFLDQIL